MKIEDEKLKEAEAKLGEAQKDFETAKYMRQYLKLFSKFQFDIINSEKLKSNSPEVYALFKTPFIIINIYILIFNHAYFMIKIYKFFFII